MSAPAQVARKPRRSNRVRRGLVLLLSSYEQSLFAKAAIDGAKSRGDLERAARWIRSHCVAQEARP